MIKIFTIVQYDGGPLVNLNNCIVFSSGGMFNTVLNNNLSYIPIRIITDEHVSVLKEKENLKLDILEGILMMLDKILKIYYQKMI